MCLTAKVLTDAGTGAGAMGSDAHCPDSFEAWGEGGKTDLQQKRRRWNWQKEEN